MEMGSEPARPRRRFRESSSSCGQERRTASMPLAPKEQDPTESLRRLTATAASAATPSSVTARSARSLRRRRPGPMRSATSERAGSPTLSARRSHLSASLETAGKRSRIRGSAPENSRGTRESSERRRRQAASAASQRWQTREQRLRSPEPRKPKTAARSSSGRCSVWSSPASSMEAMSCCRGGRAGDGGGGGGLRRRGTEGHCPMAADLPTKEGGIRTEELSASQGQRGGLGSGPEQPDSNLIKCCRPSVGPQFSFPQTIVVLLSVQVYSTSTSNRGVLFGCTMTILGFNYKTTCKSCQKVYSLHS
jgi:hypothetical protein